MDALTAIVSLLKPQTVGTKMIHGAGAWSVRYPSFGQPGFALVLKGSCWLAADGIPARVLEVGDFILFPAMPGFRMASDLKLKPLAMKAVPSGQQVDEIFHGDKRKEPSVSMLGGYFAFDPVNAAMLLDFLPGMLHIRAGDPAIGTLASVIGLIRTEAAEQRAGRTLILARLIEILLLEALRSAPAGMVATGFLAGLRDRRLGPALRAIHTRTNHPWTLATLAREAAMSRSSFAERFARVIGMTPLNYLLQWRLAVAKDLLIRGGLSVSEAAFAVGYESASGFSTAFSRETGKSPKEFIEEGGKD